MDALVLMALIVVAGAVHAFLLWWVGWQSAFGGRFRWVELVSFACLTLALCCAIALGARMQAAGAALADGLI